MFAVIVQAVECVLSLFLVGLVGFVLDKKGWFSHDFKIMLPRLVTLITLPLYLFCNIINVFNRDELVHLVYGVGAPAISIGVTFGLAWLSARLIKVEPGRRGIYYVGFTASNTIFIGLPVNVALFGEAALPYVLLYFFANTTFFWTVGNYCLSADSQKGPERIWSLATAKRVFSPPLMGFFLGILMVLANFRPPDFLMSAASSLGGLTTPLAIIFIGLTLASMSFKNLILDKYVIMLLIGRFLISPLTIIGLIYLLNLPPLMGKVFIIQSSLPVVTSAVLLAGYYRADTSFASVVVSLSTLLSLVTIPFYMVIINLLYQ